MSVTHQSVYSAPFDAVAARYDETFSSSLIGKAQRAAVWRELIKTFRKGNRVLEIGCGTGVDACFLAERGVQVVACDSSAKMVGVAAHRIQNNGLQKLAQPLLLRAEDIATLAGGELFDGAFSNFGVLNCVEDLRKLARDLAQLIKPGGSALFCWMGSCCLWEVAWYLAHGDVDKAFRRLKRDGITARISDGAFVRVHYPSVRLLAKVFAPEFRLKSVQGIGVAVPPSYLESSAQRHPRLLEACERADSWIAHAPGVRSLGDHVLVRLQREKTFQMATER
jgi:ubiquinone/menaquinone biosynthesis C-methylase UbiE